jgi:hypothetical protein
MKLAIIALVLAVSLIQSTDAYYGYGYGYGLGYGYGGYYGGYGGLYGGYGYYGKRDSTPVQTIPDELKNRTECVYTKESSILSCHGPSGVKECSVELRWNKPVSFQLFGLALPVEISEVLTEVKYRIFPRKLDNTAWIKEITDKEISLYHSEKYNDYGLFVKDKSCFEGLVTVLKSSVRKELVELEDIKEKVTLIGDLLLADKLPKLLTENTFTRTYRDLSVDEPETLMKDRLAKLVEDKVHIEEIIKRETYKTETTTKLIRDDIKVTNEHIRRVVEDLSHLTHDEHVRKYMDKRQDMQYKYGNF